MASILTWKPPKDLEEWWSGKGKMDSRRRRRRKGRGRKGIWTRMPGVVSAK